MKIILFFSLLLTFVGCDRITDLNGKTVEAQTVGNTNENIAGSNKAANTASSRTNQLTPDAAPMFVWVNVITLERLKNSDAAGSVWVNEELEKTADKNKLKAVKADIMNCAGYLASGELSKSSDFGWKFKVDPDSLAKDIAVKMRRCASEPSGNENSISNFVFAVAPPDASRPNVKIGKVDTRKLFASLPINTKNWLNGSYNLEQKIRRKNDLSLQTNDDWTDTDGDGKIDLIEVSTACDRRSGETKCSSILRLINGRWKEIGYTETD